ncbi:hypothetical protein T492DRAFT_893596 [Pavlovales sp. CCMP2436]|nr:hypothetical protein T492DRAFT_893596 [Pavlovales sp. CCMP2436]
MSRQHIYSSICDLMGLPTPGRVPTCVCAPCSHSRNRMEALKLLLDAAKTTLDLLDQLDASEETRLQLLETREAAAWEQAKVDAAQKEAEQKEAEQKEAAQKEAEQKEAEQKEAAQKEAEQKEAEQKEADAKLLLTLQAEEDADDAELLLTLQAFVARAEKDEISTQSEVTTTEGMEEDKEDTDDDKDDEDKDKEDMDDKDDQEPPPKKHCTRPASSKHLTERLDAEITLSLYYQMQRALSLCPANSQLYGCDYCLARTYTAYDRDEHLAVHLQFD